MCTKAGGKEVAVTETEVLFPNGHHILPDTNVILAQIDLIEHRSLPLYNRLKALTKSEDKHIWVFYNEYRSETAIVHIRTAAAWYNTLRGQKQTPHPTVVLITEDAANRQKAKQSWIVSVSVHRYVETMKDANVLFDLFSGERSHNIESTKAAAGRQALYPDITGELHEGHLNANQYNYLEGSIPVAAFDEPMLAPADEVVYQEAPSERQPTGRIVGIIKRNWRAYVCHIDSTSLTSTLITSFSIQTVSATLVSRLFSRIRLRTLTIDTWEPTSRYPEGHFVRALGQFEVVCGPFGKAILDCLPPEREEWIVPPKGEFDLQNIWRDRDDSRGVVVCSIDPPGCQDIDDALPAKLLRNANIEAGVRHPQDIADVSHFVVADNTMDSEAAARYLVDNGIDMLPSLLGTNLSFSSIWELTADAEIVRVRFTKSVTKSKAAFTKITRTLSDSAESSDPIDVEQKELREINSLVEEFMLLANIRVARTIEESFSQTVILRRHLPPPQTNFEKLQDILRKTNGISLDVSSSGAPAVSLNERVGAREAVFDTFVRIMVTRCMLSAGYFSTGRVPKDTFGHYGFASEIYTQFTSPIRRYGDVLLQRQLSGAIGFTPVHVTLRSKSHVERVLHVVNRQHRMTQIASRGGVEFYVGLALKVKGEQPSAGGEPDIREDAYVIRTFRNGVGVFVSNVCTLGIEGIVTFRRDTQFDAENYMITVPGAKAEVNISVFDKVVVRIEVEKNKNTQRSKVKMTLVEPVDCSAF
ncbi:hypothetical protein C8R41DRAFT_935002 [Lentinula lateritia]|uniref:RNB domain-containing protein n=1 Tax=Lentinula lateritia TaxID=40482 RepID=A0ABQ8VR44_9AGAR|nr:hypothetical protein C8R41DRAFT_935002 [Lentinula lateritia]